MGSRPRLPSLILLPRCLLPRLVAEWLAGRAMASGKSIDKPKEIFTQERRARRRPQCIAACTNGSRCGGKGGGDRESVRRDVSESCEGHAAASGAHDGC